MPPVATSLRSMAPLPSLRDGEKGYLLPAKAPFPWLPHGAAQLEGNQNAVGAIGSSNNAAQARQKQHPPSPCYCSHLLLSLLLVLLARKG